MSKRVQDTKAGQELSAWVVINKKGEFLSRIQAHYSSRGTVTVNVENMDGSGMQIGRASGYGYDKFTAAISGLNVAGVEITNHCGDQLKKPRKGYFTKDHKLPRGYRLANYTLFDTRTKQRAQIDERSPEGKALIESGVIVAGYGNAYRDGGLDILRAYGLRLIRAI